jgi:hypothetical protein
MDRSNAAARLATRRKKSKSAPRQPISRSARHGDVGKSRVGVYFYGKGEGKTQIAVDQLQLTSAKESARMKSYWREALDRLQKWLPVHLEKN